MGEWKTIESAPKDGTWFLICKAGEGVESYEVGCFEEMQWPEYVEVGDGLYRKEMRARGYPWKGFSNFHRATHWTELPAPPSQEEG
jgi:hypothetical protein